MGPLILAMYGAESSPLPWEPDSSGDGAWPDAAVPDKSGSYNWRASNVTGCTTSTASPAPRSPAARCMAQPMLALTSH